MENKLQSSSTISFSTQAEADSSISALSSDAAGDAIALMASPLKEKLDLTAYFKTGRILCLCVSGDPEPSGATLDFSWVLNLRHQCIEYDIPFYFTSTGANFLFRNRTFHIEKKFQSSQARKADVHYFPVKRAFNPPVGTKYNQTEGIEIPIENAGYDTFSNGSFTVSNLNFHIEEDDSCTESEFTGKTAPNEVLTIPGINYEVEVDSDESSDTCSVKSVSLPHNDSPDSLFLSSLDGTQITDYCEQLFYRLDRSKFRSSFHLHNQEKEYYYSQGDDVIRKHAVDFISTRLAPAEPANDGKQTPMRGHPVFIAQHATACCCRGCLSKWHHIPEHRELTEDEQKKIVNVLMAWINRDLKKQ